ncbi:hypothetical protein AAE478_002529 [Parahypoxylon ruwenzoriense]
MAITIDNQRRTSHRCARLKKTTLAMLNFPAIHDIIRTEPRLFTFPLFWTSRHLEVLGIDLEPEREGGVGESKNPTTALPELSSSSIQHRVRTLTNDMKPARAKYSSLRSLLKFRTFEDLDGAVASQRKQQDGGAFYLEQVYNGVQHLSFPYGRNRGVIAMASLQLPFPLILCRRFRSSEPRPSSPSSQNPLWQQPPEDHAVGPFLAYIDVADINQYRRMYPSKNRSRGGGTSTASHDAVAASLLIALAHHVTLRGQSGENGDKDTQKVIAQLLTTLEDDDKYMHLYTAQISHLLLDRLQSPAERCSCTCSSCATTSAMMKIRPSRIAFEPSETFASRLVTVVDQQASMFSSPDRVNEDSIPISQTELTDLETLVLDAVEVKEKDHDNSSHYSGSSKRRKIDQEGEE